MKGEEEKGEGGKGLCMREGVGVALYSSQDVFEMR